MGCYRMILAAGKPAAFLRKFGIAICVFSLYNGYGSEWKNKRGTTWFSRGRRIHHEAEYLDIYMKFLPGVFMLQNWVRPTDGRNNGLRDLVVVR